MQTTNSSVVAPTPSLFHQSAPFQLMFPAFLTSSPSNNLAAQPTTVFPFVVSPASFLPTDSPFKPTPQLPTNSVQYREILKSFAHSQAQPLAKKVEFASMYSAAVFKPVTNQQPMMHPVVSTTNAATVTPVVNANVGPRPSSKLARIQVQTHPEHHQHQQHQHQHQLQHPHQHPQQPQQRVPVKQSVPLASHVVATAAGLRPLCKICKKTFKNKTVLRKHMVLHSGKKTYVCTIKGCRQSFFQKASLVRHYRTHTGETPYECPHCPKQFADRANMNKHKVLHLSKPTKLYAFQCECHMVFREASDLRQHREFKCKNSSS